MPTCGLTERAFISFMKRHRGHLKVLSIRTLDLLKPVTAQSEEAPASTWQIAIETVAPCMSLEKVRIERLQDEVQRKYNGSIREKSEKHPFLAEWDARL